MTVHGGNWVQFENVSKTFISKRSQVQAVADVSMGVRKGEFVSFIGPSGCGKSTLLMMAAGLITPNHGTVRIDGLPVLKPYTDLGIVFQQDLLMDWRTIFDNVMVQIEIRRLDRGKFRERARELLALVGLTGFEEKYPHELSGGMRQRASICRGLIHDPPLLLMDEPFGALDALTREQMNLDLLKIWSQYRKTVLFVTHSISEAVFLSDRVIVMSTRPGRILESIDIELSRPREPSIRDGNEFASYSKRIRDALPVFQV